MCDFLPDKSVSETKLFVTSDKTGTGIYELQLGKNNKHSCVKMKLLLSSSNLNENQSKQYQGKMAHLIGVRNFKQDNDYMVSHTRFCYNFGLMQGAQQ